MGDINIGQRIIDFRRDKNMTIKELAQKAGVTSSLLSQIERGLANPSINTLRSISKVLEMPMFLFFIEEPGIEELVVRRDERKKIELTESKNIVYELLSPSLSGAIEFVNMIIKPGGVSSRELMEHDGEEVALVSRGHINLYIGKELITLSPGDSVKIPARTLHKWENPFVDMAEIIFAITPPTF